MSKESVTLTTTTTTARHASTRIKVARADHFRGLQRVRKAERYRRWRLERSIEGGNALAERFKKKREKTTRLILSARTRWNREKGVVDGINCPRRLQPIAPALETPAEGLTAQGSIQAESSGGSIAASLESRGATNQGPYLRSSGEVMKLSRGVAADEATDDHGGPQNLPPSVVVAHDDQEAPSVEGPSPQPAGIQSLPFGWGRMVDDETWEPLTLRQPSWEFHARKGGGCVDEEGHHQQRGVNERDAADLQGCHDLCCVEPKKCLKDAREASAEASFGWDGTSSASSRGVEIRGVDLEEAGRRVGGDSPCSAPPGIGQLGGGRRQGRPVGVFEQEELLSDVQEDPPQALEPKGRLIFSSDREIPRPRREPDSRCSPRTPCSSSIGMYDRQEDEAGRNVRRRESLTAVDTRLGNGELPWKSPLPRGPEPRQVGSSSEGGGMIQGEGVSGRGAGTVLSSRDSIEGIARSDVGHNMADVQETRNRYLRQVEQRVRDEAVEELRREAALKKVSPYPVRLECLGRRHKKEREAARTYLNRTRSDAELIIVQKMAKLGLIR